LKSSLNAQNFILAINVWAIPLVCYTAGLIKWTQAEVRTLDISTRKMLNMYKCFSMSVAYYLLKMFCIMSKLSPTSKEEPLLQAVHGESWWSSLQESPSKFKARISDEHFGAWKDKPLHGQFIVDGVDIKQQWSWLFNSKLKKETEGLVMAAENQAISTNCIKANIYHQACSAQCRLCECIVLRP